jgi:hypothetical protein
MESSTVCGGFFLFYGREPFLSASPVCGLTHAVYSHKIYYVNLNTKTEILLGVRQAVHFAYL